MKIRGFLIVLILAVVVVYLLYFGKLVGKKSQIQVMTDRYAQAKVDLTKVNMAELEKAVLAFASSEGRTPEDIKELQRSRILVTGAVDGWGNFIKYERLSDTSFKITSAGKDGAFGSADDIVLTD
jgi:hypothetical protein